MIEFARLTRCYRLPHLKKTLLLLIFISHSLIVLAEPERPTPLRRAVDIYNAMGSASRMIAFMKIGASPDDLRHLNILSAQAAHHNLPKAYLAGGVIYFRGLPEPLKVIDLRRRLFTINGRTLSLGNKDGLKDRLEALEHNLFPRRSGYFFIDWLLPQAVAAPDPGVAVASTSGVLALSGLAANIQCFEDSSTTDCGDQFMGALGALGEVGGFSGLLSPVQVFCSPDFHGHNKVVVNGGSKKILEVIPSSGEALIYPGSDEPTLGESRAAVALLKICDSKEKIARYNVAFAYPRFANVQAQVPAAPEALTPPAAVARGARNTDSSTIGDAAR